VKDKQYPGIPAGILDEDLEKHMSDKRYSTDDLIAILIDSHFPARPINGDVVEAIIRKLRAADALKDAGERVGMAVSIYADPNDAATFELALIHFEEA
jgi:hypothetical protein